MIEIRDLRYRTLHIDSIDIPEGITTIIGKNGSGKTTLLRLCAGITVPESGTILINGTPPRQTNVGWVNEYPDRNMLFSKVYDEIASPLRFLHIAPYTVDCEILKIADQFGIRHLLSRLVYDLSGGEKVLVALAAALVADPKIVILDEYDSHLDSERCLQIEHVIRNSGCHYILRCTQQMETAAGSNTVIMLERGNLVHAGHPADVFPHLEGTAHYPLSWRVGL
jgi:energy-coupling factor transport system ATP-binding protein